jgi:esterase/lipase superfamily enzyme
MTKVINYTKTSPEMTKALRRLMEKSLIRTIDTLSFSAGWNAANSKVKIAHAYFQWRQEKSYPKSSVTCFVAGWKARMEKQLENSR